MSTRLGVCAAVVAACLGVIASAAPAMAVYEIQMLERDTDVASPCLAGLAATAYGDDSDFATVSCAEPMQRVRVVAVWSDGYTLRHVWRNVGALSYLKTTRVDCAEVSPSNTKPRRIVFSVRDGDLTPGVIDGRAVIACP